MAKRDFPTITVLRQLLNYDPETGKLYWKYRPLDMFASKRAFGMWNTRFANKEAFTAKCKLHGYHVGNVNYKLCMAHRVIWAFMTGKYPEFDVDHINMDRADNRWCNLREATRSQNNCNSGIRKDNKSGYRGVHFSNQYDKWQAKIQINGKVKHLGFFGTAKEAGNAFNKASPKYHGEFAGTK